MDRLQSKYALFSKLGVLFGPLQRLIEHPDEYNEQEQAETIARFCDEYPRLNAEFLTFSRGQPGHNYAIQYSRFFNALDSVKVGLEYGKRIEDVVPAGYARAQAAIDAIPVPATSVILEAGSPFAAYCRLRELCEVDTTTSLVWLDPYLDGSIFHRYLSAVRPKASVILVTCEPDSHSGGRDKKRWAEFLDISRLYAAERGANRYTLIMQATLHDRWVVFDYKRIYNLGGSAKDAADRDNFTIALIEANPSNLQLIQKQIATGREWFGPSNQVHP